MNRVLFITSVFLCLGLAFVGASIQAAETKMDPVAKDNCIKACKKCEDACRTLAM